MIASITEQEKEPDIMYLQMEVYYITLEGFLSDPKKKKGKLSLSLIRVPRSNYKFIRNTGDRETYRTKPQGGNKENSDCGS